MFTGDIMFVNFRQRIKGGYPIKQLILPPVKPVGRLRHRAYGLKPFIAILKEEARIAMTLSHRNIVRVYDFEKKEDQHFLVMEHIEGCSFRDALAQDGKFPLASVMLVMPP